MLKLTLVFLGIFGWNTVSVAQDTHAKKTLEERVAELEANQSLNIFTLNGIFDTRYDHIDTSNYKNLEYLRLRFSLDLDANISKNIQFYSRYTTVKFANRWYEQGSGSTRSQDFSSADNYSKSKSDVVLEKAYVDFTMPNPDLVLSVGRLPTVDGPPSNYWDGRARMGTYPLLTYNSVLDGFAGTYKLDSLIPEHQHLALRAVYTPFSQYNVGTGGTGAYVTPPTDTSGRTLKTLASLYALQVDFAYDEPWFSKNVDLIVQYYKSNRFNSIGSLDLEVGGTTMMIEANGLFGTGFDLSYSLLAGNMRSIGDSTTPGTGYGTTKEDETLSGQVSLLSTRYSFTDRWFVGFEWIHGTKNLFYYSGASENLTDLYSTRGEAYHIYLTHKLEPNLALRLGWSQQNPRYTEPGLGIPVARGGERVDTTYLNMRLDF